MKPNPTREQAQIDRAIELAHFIHGRKGIALGIVEEALCSLDLMLGRQDKIRRNYTHLLGFLKWQERSRPARTTIRLTPAQMLQWLVYEKSEPRERDAEYPDSLSPPSHDDMVVRYIKHLVYLTLKRNSFYVTLGLGRLLYDYGTQEVRLMYDVLTQSDTARMKDLPYLRKQKMILMEKVCDRFGRMLQTMTTAHGEKRFEIQASTQWLVSLVNECLRRFTPWQTACVVQDGFDPTLVPGLYFSGTSPADEDPIEINRIHTVLDPGCFRLLVNGLSRFVRGLPADSPDKHCDYDQPDERLAVPQFGHVANGPPRGDRFRLPKVEPEDYLQLQSRRKAQARRRKAYAAQVLRVYVDNVERAAFDPRRMASVRLDIGPEADLIEVRGEDAEGELLLAALIVCSDDIPPGGSFRDWIVLEGGQKVTIQLTPIRDADGDVEIAQVEVGYAETNLIRAVSRLATRAWFAVSKKVERRHEDSETVRPEYAWVAKLGVVVAVVVVVVAVIWFRFRPPHLEAPPPVATQPSIPKTEPASPTAPAPPTVRPPVQKEPAQLIAQAAWSEDPTAALRASPIEATRNEPETVDLSRAQSTLIISLPLYGDDGQPYTRYRMTLVAEGKRLWQQTLRAPERSLTGRDHILSLTLVGDQLSDGSLYELRVQGQTPRGWQSVGRIPLNIRR